MDRQMQNKQKPESLARAESEIGKLIGQEVRVWVNAGSGELVELTGICKGIDRDKTLVLMDDSDKIYIRYWLYAKRKRRKDGGNNQGSSKKEK